MDLTTPNRASTSSHRPQARHPQPSPHATPSSSSLTEAGNRSLDRIRASRSTTISSSASSSSTSLPRSILHRPQSVRSGVSASVEMQRQGDVLSVSASEAAVIFGAEQSRTSPRLRTLSASSSGNGHGRLGLKKRPSTPGSGASSSAAAGSAQPTSRSVPHVPLPSTLSARVPSTPVLGGTMTSTPTHPRSPSVPTMSSLPSHLVTPPGLSSIHSASPQSNASTSAYSTPSPHRRPSLASPLPATPIIPSHLPKPAVRNPPAPLNLAAASPSRPLRHPHSHHTATGSLSSPHAPAHSPTAQGHHTQRMHSAPTPPSSHASSALQGYPQSQGHRPNSSQGPGPATQSLQAQGWATHAQYISIPRPGSGGQPDSPSTSAMMKRLLAKPAPISPAYGFGSGASGSDSEGGRMGRVGANMKTRSKTRLRSSSPRGGVRSEEDIEERRGTAKAGGAIPPIDFDLDLDTLNRDIAAMGRWMAKQDANGSSERMITPAVSMPDLKEKEKEKRVRNVLRRKPSASAANSSKPVSPLQPASTPSSTRTSNAQPIPVSSTSSTPRTTHLPPMGFSPLSISPLGLVEETFTKENTAFIHPPTPHKQHAHAQNASATMHRSASASAALPTSSATVTRAPGGVHGQPISSQSPLHPQRHPAHPHQAAPAPLGRASSLQPPSQYLHLPRSTRSAASSQPSSRGSSPGRSPIASGLLSAAASGTVNPTSNRLPPAIQSQQPHSPGAQVSTTPTSPTSSKRISSSGKPTPAASLVEAYKKQEREREARRLAAEKERQERKEEREMALGSSRKKIAEAKSFITSASRRHSVSGVDALAAERPKEQIQTTRTEHGHGHAYVNRPTAHLAAPERAFIGLAAGSTLTVDSFTTTSSGPRISDDDNARARTGLGFEAIEKLASSVIADARATKTLSKPTSDARKQEIRIRAPGSEEGEEDVDVTPYYTVFGSSATRVAAADRPVEEGWSVAAYGQGYWDSDVLGRRADVEGGKEKEKDGRKESFSRTLSRKVSGRWKKQGGTVVGALIDEERQGRGGIRGRASMQERRKAGSASRRDETDYEADARTKMRNRRSLRLSIDKFSDFLDREEDRPAMPSLVRGKSAVGVVGAAREKEVDIDSDCDTECEKEETKKSSKTKKEKEKEKPTSSPSGSTGSGGSKFWKLMRRISVGGLKEKYRDASLSPPPPVPALPKDIHNTLPALQASRSNDSSLKRHPVEARKNSSASSSPTAATAPAAQKKVLPSALVPQAKASSAVPAVTPAAANSSQPRPSTTTRSSSPVSSDVASSKFFHRTHSARSSTSSFDDEQPPPLPKNLTGSNTKFFHHIIPPSELSKAHGHEEEGTVMTSQRARVISVSTQRMPRPDEDWQIVRSPSVELPSLPLPPRRQPQAPTTGAANASEPSEEKERPESPTIPSFSTTAAVNAFPARRLSSTLSARSRASPNSPHASSPSSMLPSPSSVTPPNITSLPPPPRPLRSAQRPVTIAARPPIIEEPSVPTPTSISIPQGRKSESHISRVSPQPTLTRNRRSSGGMSIASSTATARALRRRSSSFGGGTTASSVRSLSLSLTTPPAGATTFTFREMDDASRPRQALTEREKAARWEDLLERSARAGGTLHLAGGGRVLASDRMKVSKW